jgi:phosphoglycolate phosphatase-like HAD superfamily hydrolase
MKILAVDFDGVISDSALKSLFVSHNAYCRHFGAEVKKSFGGQLFTFDNWELMKKKYHREMEKYRQLRAYVELSCDFLVMTKIIEEQIEVRSQEEFIKIRNEMDLDYHFFHELFFQEKEKWQKKDFTKWFSLSPVYEEVVAVIKQLLEEGVKVVIATSNLGKAIHPAFHQDYLGFPMSLKDIFDKNYGKNKSDHMKAIVAQYKVNFEDIYFVDDQLSYLEETQILGVNVFLAGWGYCTEEQKNIARQKSITVIEEEKDFYPTMKQFFDSL